MENEKIICPLTPEIIKEADKETDKMMEYFQEHQKELTKMSEKEFFMAMMNARKS